MLRYVHNTKGKHSSHSVLCVWASFLPEESFQGRIKMLLHTISLGVAWGSFNLVNTRDLAKLSHIFRNEIVSVIG